MCAKHPVSLGLSFKSVLHARPAFLGNRNDMGTSLHQPSSIGGHTTVPSQSFHTIIHGATTSVITIVKFRSFFVSGSSNKYRLKQLVLMFNGSFHEIARCFSLELTGYRWLGLGYTIRVPFLLSYNLDGDSFLYQLIIPVRLSLLVD